MMMLMMMAMAKKYKKVKYEIDLIKVLERALADKPRAVRSKLRALMNSPLFKQKYGENVIDEIEKRTLKKRVDKNNVKFKAPYSRAYQKSLEFKVYGKSPLKVNLRLTGEMLASMKVGKSGDRTVKILMADNHNNSKAHGHIHGIKRKINQGAKLKKGQKAATTKVKRDFLGLPTDDENKMMLKTIKEFNSESLKLLVDFEKTDIVTGVATSTDTEILGGVITGTTAGAESDGE